MNHIAVDAHTSHIAHTDNYLFNFRRIAERKKRRNVTETSEHQLLNPIELDGVTSRQSKIDYCARTANRWQIETFSISNHSFDKTNNFQINNTKIDFSRFDWCASAKWWVHAKYMGIAKKKKKYVFSSEWNWLTRRTKTQSFFSLFAALPPSQFHFEWIKIANEFTRNRLHDNSTICANRRKKTATKNVKEPLYRILPWERKMQKLLLNCNQWDVETLQWKTKEKKNVFWFRPESDWCVTVSPNHGEFTLSAPIGQHRTVIDGDLFNFVRSLLRWWMVIAEEYVFPSICGASAIKENLNNEEKGKSERLGQCVQSSRVPAPKNANKTKSNSVATNFLILCTQFQWMTEWTAIMSSQRVERETRICLHRRQNWNPTETWKKDKMEWSLIESDFPRASPARPFVCCAASSISDRRWHRFYYTSYEW